MLNILEGIYHNGIIKIKNNCKIKDDSHLKILIFEEEKEKKNMQSNKRNKIIFRSYKFDNFLDKVNLRDFAYDD